MRKILSVLTVLLISAIALSGCRLIRQSGPENKEGIIKIGYVIPLSGDLAKIGNDLKSALIMATEEINQSDYLDGSQIKLIIEDGQCSGMAAATAAQKLINVDRVKVILGGGCSSEALSIAPIAESNEVILFSSSATSPDLTGAGDFVFRNTPSDVGIADFIAKKLKGSGYSNIALFSENNDYGSAIHHRFQQSAAEVGLNITEQQLFLSGTRDFRTDILRLKQSNPEALLINPQSGVAAGLIVRQTRELGWDVPIYGVGILTSKDALEAGGDAMNGTVNFSTPFVDESLNPKGAEFLKKFTDRFGEPQMKHYTAATYDALYLVADAIKKSGYDSKGIRDYLYGLDSFTGAAGTYHFDKNGDVVGISFSIQTIKDGHVVSYEG